MHRSLNFYAFRKRAWRTKSIWNGNRGADRRLRSTAIRPTIKSFGSLTALVDTDAVFGFFIRRRRDQWKVSRAKQRPQPARAAALTASVLGGRQQFNSTGKERPMTKKATADNSAVEKRTPADQGEVAAKLETVLRADGADVVGSIAVINTSRVEAERFAFDRPHHAPIFGFGSEHAAREYARLLSQHGVEFTCRRPTPAEAAQMQNRTVFVIAVEAGKFNPARKVA
jgi:hypothetical protein